MKTEFIYNLVWVSFIVLFCFCSDPVNEADNNYKNAVEYYSKLNKQSDKKEDALYFYVLAAKAKKYKTVETAKHIYSLAADILINDNKITIDDKFRLNDNILFAITMLIDKSKNLTDSLNRESISEAQNIVSSFDEPYVTIRKIVEEKSIDDFNKLESLALQK
ncbi:MAG: hypothetical protein V1773_01890 [bacterium]